MRAASTYRGARRNAAVSPARGRSRFYGWHAWEQANVTANIHQREAQANAAREAAAKALVGTPHGVAGDVVNSAFLKFYRGEKRTRVVNRIIRALEKIVPKTATVNVV